jgi:hypothetical protein
MSNCLRPADSLFPCVLDVYAPILEDCPQTSRSCFQGYLRSAIFYIWRLLQPSVSISSAFALMMLSFEQD